MPIHVPPISRRRFLQSAAASTGLLAAGRLAAAELAPDPDRWAIISDTHVWERRNEKHKDVCPAKNFRQAAEGMLALKRRPAGAIFCGDNVYLQGNPGDYAVLADLVRPLRDGGLPLHFALGNHDHRKNFCDAFAKDAAPPPVADKYVSVVPAGKANWFLLDSLETTNVTPGLVGREQIAWLAQALDARSDKPALVVVHHNPDPLGKFNGIRDTAALFATLVPRKHVKAFFYGHTHAWNVWSMEGIHLVNVPATAWLFDAKQPRGWLEAALANDCMTLTLHGLAPAHPAHGRVTELKWRT